MHHYMELWGEGEKSASSTMLSQLSDSEEKSSDLNINEPLT